jgi:hypothetical protein
VDTGGVPVTVLVGGHTELTRLFRTH